MTTGATEKSATSIKTANVQRERSPNYPAISLEEAITKAKRLYAEIKRSMVQPKIVVSAWGYKDLNGSNRLQLAALKQYGLLEADKSGNLRLSRRGMEFAIRSPDSPEYIASLTEAALAPTIFRDLYLEMRDASDEILRQHLMLNKGFSEDGAKRAIQAYRDSLTLANLDDIRYNDVIEEESTMPNIDHNDGHMPIRSSMNTSLHDLRESTAQPAREPDYRVPLSNGVIAEVTFHGNQVTPLELNLLREFLVFAEKALAATSTSVVQEPASVPSTLSANEAS